MSDFVINPELIEEVQKAVNKSFVELQNTTFEEGDVFTLNIRVDGVPFTANLGRWHSGKKNPKKAGKYVRQYPSGDTAICDFDGGEWLTEDGDPSFYKDGLKWRKFKVLE